ncbi:MAG: fluoride efflux transporter CrcB [Phycisphaeraceae bacterium]
MFQKLLWIAVAGAAGTLARYGLAGLVHRWPGSSEFPWGTLVVNAAGCLLFGVVWGLAEYRHVISDDLRPIILIGFMGAFTTFSTFAFETTHMLQGAQWGYAAANIVAQNVLGVIMVLAGFALARAI